MYKQKAIVFVRTWRGKVPGTADDQLDYGVQQLLVQRGIAKWREPQLTEQKAKRRERHGLHS